jgi:hypothetical protein
VRAVNTSTGFGGGDMTRKKIPGSQPSNCPLTLFGGIGGPEAYRPLLWEPTYPKPFGELPIGRLRSLAIASGLVIASLLSVVATSPSFTRSFPRHPPTSGKPSRHGGQLCSQ